MNSVEEALEKGTYGTPQFKDDITPKIEDYNKNLMEYFRSIP